MKLENITLEKYLEIIPVEKYHNSKDLRYFNDYDAFKKKAKKYHDSIVSLANYAEAKKKNLVFLNDHGVLHIETVINRATELVKSENCDLNAKEIYYLLTAIHLHDIGNLHGRVHHIDNMRKVMLDLNPFISLDIIEKTRIAEIAEAHGGKLSNGDKDKIGKLDVDIKTLDSKVRAQLLASILRLADELSDDRNRCEDALLEEEHLDNKSLAYHVYAHCISSIEIEHEKKQIEFIFDVPLKYAQNKVRKDRKKIYIIDEIYERTLKSFHELSYTMRFTRGVIDLTSISVIINFTPDFIEGHTPPSRITYTLKEEGYPAYYNDIYVVHSDLLSGKKIAQQISKKNSLKRQR